MRNRFFSEGSQRRLATIKDNCEGGVFSYDLIRALGTHIKNQDRTFEEGQRILKMEEGQYNEHRLNACLVEAKEL